MTIDRQARLRLLEERKTRSLVEGMKDSLKSAFQSNAKDSTQNEEVLKLVVKREEDSQLTDEVVKIGKAIAILYKSVTNPPPLPKLFRIWGNVEITRSAPIKIQNFDDVAKYFKSLEEKVGGLAAAISSMPTPIINVPKQDQKEIKIDTQNVVEAIHELEGKLTKGGSSDDLVEAFSRVEGALTLLANRPQMTAQPVTNINLNALNGVFKATTLNVGTSATALPPTSIANRRSLLIYNGSANTIYLGGPEVAVGGTGKGLPVPTLSYAPAFDIGQNMVLYGIAASTSAVTILEMSHDSAGR